MRISDWSSDVCSSDLMSIQITSAFDGGNIRVLSITDDTAELEIETDHQSDFYQWFYFRVAGGDAATMRITNAGGSAYPGGWPGYKVRASTDRETWPQVETTHATGILEWRCPGAPPLVWFASFAPYPGERNTHLRAPKAARTGTGRF